MSFKKSKVKLHLLTDIDILLMIEKGIWKRKSHSIYWYAKPNSKTWEIMIKAKASNKNFWVDKRFFSIY